MYLFAQDTGSLSSSLNRLKPLSHGGTGEGQIPIFSKLDVERRSAASEPRVFRFIRGQDSVQQRLFEATAQAKIWTSKIAMHLDRAVRDRFFAQLDRLHDLEEWYESDAPLALESYKAFVRAILYVGIDSAPALALMPSGNLLAMWEAGSDRLSVEFLPGDRVKWVLSRKIDGGVERAAGETAITRLEAVLAPYDANKWFHGG
ncbi:MAG TPA: hypothetical protein VK533_04530 [Sphingomonas sp.]|uniref:hypothetical protein n=1 Tax=Sphingomonas sp. TaxID=28214 RepID=UPI002C2641B7|nr:hypothetical protein [Sphingomonas sp.]HMI18790.1 hypothetical protein [Sphingomonas sp.]